MATASEILSAIAPQFDDASGRQTFLDLSESRTSSTFFGANRPEAVAYRAAHMADLAASAAVSSGASGPITSKKEGDLAVSFGFGTSSGSKGDSAYLSQTSYKKILLNLIHSNSTTTKITEQPYTPVIFIPGIGLQ